MQHSKRKSLFIFLPLAVWAITSQAEIVWIDFGVSSAQTSGNWNNVTGQSDHKTDLIDSAGNTTGIALNLSGFTATNNFNDGVAANAAMFDAFEPASVITDALYANIGNTGTLTFNGLDIGNSYHLTLTGARSNDQERFTRYSVSGFGNETLQVAGNAPAAGTGTTNWNNDDIVTISNITGVTSFNLTVVGNQSSDFTGDDTWGYINALQLEVVPEPSTLALFALSGIAGLFAFRRRK